MENIDKAYWPNGLGPATNATVKAGFGGYGAIVPAFAKGVASNLPYGAAFLTGSALSYTVNNDPAAVALGKGAIGALTSVPATGGTLAALQKGGTWLAGEALAATSSRVAIAATAGTLAGFAATSLLAVVLNSQKVIDERTGLRQDQLKDAAVDELAHRVALDTPAFDRAPLSVRNPLGDVARDKAALLEQHKTIDQLLAGRQPDALSGDELKRYEELKTQYGTKETSLLDAARDYVRAKVTDTNHTPENLALRIQGEVRDAQVTAQLFDSQPTAKFKERMAEDNLKVIQGAPGTQPAPDVAPEKNPAADAVVVEAPKPKSWKPSGPV